MLPATAGVRRKDHHDVFAVLREVGWLPVRNLRRGRPQQQRTDPQAMPNMVRKERQLMRQMVQICPKRQTSFAYLQLVGNDSSSDLCVPRIASRAISATPLVTVTRTFKLKCYGPLWSCSPKDFPSDLRSQ